MNDRPLRLVIGNHNTSSWSLRAWLVLRLAGLAFQEVRVPLRQVETSAWLRRLSPNGRVPVLKAGDLDVWDSAAIIEHVAELNDKVWPKDPRARAVARSASAEIHSGIPELRRFMPMDVVGRFGPPGRLVKRVKADVDRVQELWRYCLERHGQGGPFLFGEFCAADAVMAPIVSRFVTYGVDLPPRLEAYAESVMAWPPMVEWQDAALAEVEALAEGAPGVEIHVVDGEGRREPLDPFEADDDRAPPSLPKRSQTPAAEAAPPPPRDVPPPAPAQPSLTAPPTPSQAPRRLFVQHRQGEAEGANAPAPVPEDGSGAGAQPGHEPAGAAKPPAPVEGDKPEASPGAVRGERLVPPTLPQEPAADPAPVAPSTAQRPPREQVPSPEESGEKSAPPVPRVRVPPRPDISGTWREPGRAAVPRHAPPRPDPPAARPEELAVKPEPPVRPRPKIEESPAAPPPVREAPGPGGVDRASGDRTKADERPLARPLSDPDDAREPPPGQRRWRPAGVTIKPIGDGTRRRR